VRFAVENAAFVLILPRALRMSPVSSISPIVRTHSPITESEETQQLTHLTVAVGQLAEAMRYKPKGRGFFSRRGRRDLSLT
jgi:hypothetical protein